MSPDKCRMKANDKSSYFDMKRGELILSSFASLLSAAETSGLVIPLNDGNSKLSSLSSFLSFSPHMKCSFPSLTLKSSHQLQHTSRNMSLQEMAALSLAAPYFISKSTQHELEVLPRTLLKSISSSMQQLVDSRLRSSTIALLSQATKLGMLRQNTEVLTNLLIACSAPIQITTVVTSFHVLSQPHHRLPSSQLEEREQGVRLMLPLLLEVVLDVKALGKMVTFPLSAPGTITGLFDSLSAYNLQSVEVTLDTAVLLEAMTRQAKSFVKKTLSYAVNIATSLNYPSNRSQNDFYLDSTNGIMMHNTLNSCTNFDCSSTFSSMVSLSNQTSSSSTTQRSRRQNINRPPSSFLLRNETMCNSNTEINSRHGTKQVEFKSAEQESPSSHLYQLPNKVLTNYCSFENKPNNSSDNTKGTSFNAVLDEKDQLGRFPPQLSNTLNQVSKGENGPLKRSNSHQNISDLSRRVKNWTGDTNITDGDCQKNNGKDSGYMLLPPPQVSSSSVIGTCVDTESKHPLHHELFSWLKGDQMLLSTADLKRSDDDAGDDNPNENQLPMPRTLSSLSNWNVFTNLAAAQWEHEQQEQQYRQQKDEDEKNKELQHSFPKRRKTNFPLEA